MSSRGFPNENYNLEELRNYVRVNKLNKPTCDNQILITWNKDKIIEGLKKSRRWCVKDLSKIKNKEEKLDKIAEMAVEQIEMNVDNLLSKLKVPKGFIKDFVAKKKKEEEEEDPVPELESDSSDEDNSSNEEEDEEDKSYYKLIDEWKKGKNMVYQSTDCLEFIKNEVVKDWENNKELVKKLYDDTEDPWFYNIKSDDIYDGDVNDEDEINEEDEEDENEDKDELIIKLLSKDVEEENEDEEDDDTFMCDKCGEKYCTEECNTLTDGESQLGDYCKKCWKEVKMISSDFTDGLNIQKELEYYEGVLEDIEKHPDYEELCGFYDEQIKELKEENEKLKKEIYK